MASVVMKYGSQPRTLALVNAGLAILTLSSFSYLVSSFPIGLCSGLSLGALLTALTGVGLHALSVAWLSPAVLQNQWPWDVRDVVYKRPDGSEADAADEQPQQVYEQLADGPGAKGTGTGSGSGTGVWSRVKCPRRSPACVFRSTVGSACCLSVLFLYIFGIIGIWLHLNTVAPLDDVLSLPGLQGQAVIKRSSTGADGSTSSSTGTVHVQASSLHDLFYAQGVAHAQQRLWQMEFQRRVGSGTLCEAVGSGALDDDKLFRTLGVRRAAQRDYDAMPAGDATKAALDAYADGVNAYLQAATAVGSGGFLPLEFRVLGIKPAPWSAVDSLVWSKIMSYDLSGNLDQELSRYRLRYKYGLTVDRVNQLLPPYNTSHYPTVLSAAAISPPYGPGPVPTAANQPSHAAMAAAERRMLAELDELVFSAQQQQQQSNEQAQAQTQAAAGAGAGAETLAVREAVQRALHHAAGVVDTAVESATTAPPGEEAVEAADIFEHSPLPVRAAFAVLRALGAAGDALRSSVGYSTPDAASCRPVQWRKQHVQPVSGMKSALLRGSFKVGASNNWVVSGNRTATGKPLLCNDPHLQLMAPSIWMLMALASPQLNAIGASFPGLPGIVIGRNDRIAWGVTNTGVDVQDAYVMQDVQGTNGASYFFNGVPTAYTQLSEVIAVKGEDSVTLPLRVSRYGTVVTDNGVMDGAGAAMALRWVSTDPNISDTTLSAFLALNVASNFSDFRAALAMWTAPSQNVIYADVDGNIGYQMPGWIPQRNLAAGHTGAWPVPGNSSTYDWLAPFAFDALPRTFNPPEGYVVSANNQVPPPGFPFISADWDVGSEGFRAGRITDRVLAGGANASGGLTVIDMSSIQLDTVSYAARDVLAIVCNMSGAQFATPAAAGVRAVLCSWDGNAAVGSVAATIWVDTWAHLSALPAAEVGGKAWEDAGYLLTALASDTSPAGPDPACTARGGNCTAWVAAVLAAVGQKYSLDASGAPGAGANIPPYGSPGLHQAVFTHQILGQSPLACLADRSVSHGGDPSTVNVGGFSLDQSSSGSTSRFTQTSGPSYRQIVDLSAPDSGSLFVHPMGQSGAEFGDGYDDLLQWWATGRYLPMTTATDAGGEATTLNPA